MSFCFKCGTQLNEGANFCHNCGAEVIAVQNCVETDANLLGGDPVKLTETSSFVVDDISTEPAASVSIPEPPENASTYFVDTSFEIKESTPEERQSLLDRMSSKIKTESILWKIFAILNIVGYVSMWIGLFVSISIASAYGISLDDGSYDEEYYYDDYDAEYTVAISEEDMDFYSDLLYIMYSISLIGATAGIYVYVPSTIIGFIMAKKSANCRKTLYEDCSVAYKRYSSVGPIILGIFFNKWTLICTIPSVIMVKKNSKMLMEIAEMQRNYYSYNH